MVLAILAGMLIAFAAAASSTAAHSVANVGLARTITAAIFPFGLGMVVLMGAELFTGSCLIATSALDKRVRLITMLKNWLLVYIGNFIGSIIVAAGGAFSGQFKYSAGGLAVATIKTAAAKCALPFGSALILGIFCNVLVCLGVLLALSAKDTSGKILGAYLPVFFFVISGFEHSVANMYYIPAGIFAKMNPVYAQLAATAGVDVSKLTWGNFLLGNLLPVTLGNIIGGVAVGALLWYCFLRKKDA
jgi:formate/nitrite transporter